jgi:GNAT superfamily N-acetyltransferase
MNAVKIIDIHAADWQIYKGIRLRALIDSPDAFSSSYEQENSRSDHEWQKRLNSSPAIIEKRIFAIVDDKTVGLAWTRVSSEYCQTALIYQMWVDPLYRRTGIASELFNALISWCKKNQINTVELDVAKTNSPARIMYESIEFIATENLNESTNASTPHIQRMRLNIT